MENVRKRDGHPSSQREHGIKGMIRAPSLNETVGKKSKDLFSQSEGASKGEGLWFSPIEREDLSLRNDGTPDLALLAVTLALVVFGTVMVSSAGIAYATFRYDAPAYFIHRQIVWVIIGMAAMLLGSRIQPRLLCKLSGPLYLVTLVLLILVLIVGFVGNGAQRRIRIGPLTLQPSEIAKLTIVLLLARYFDRLGDKADSDGKKKTHAVLLYDTLYPIGIMAVPIGLVLLQRHLSCIIILGMIGLAVILAAGRDLRYILAFGGAGGIGAALFALLTDYTKERITVWRNPELYRLTGGWQTLQGLMAIGSGGLFGLGLGKSVLKYCYVSEPANDMIFTILCEELGFVGAMAALALFCYLILRGLRLSVLAKDRFERLVAFGITMKIAIQVILNIAVVTNTIPNTGISLPFFSYGGSSLIMILFEVGILLSISRTAKIQK